jgi:hypothetical protein
MIGTLAAARWSCVARHRGVRVQPQPIAIANRIGDIRDPAVNRRVAAFVLQAGTAATTAGAVASRRIVPPRSRGFWPGFKTWLPPLATLPTSPPVATRRIPGMTLGELPGSHGRSI